MIAEPIVPPEALTAIRAPFLTHAAEAIEPPVLVPLAQLLDLTGEAMRARLFVVQGEGGEELCLRPDFTVPVVRAHVASGRAEGRYRYEGRAFRVGTRRPQEFLQIGLEALGAPATPEADADIVATAWRAAAAGGRDDLSILLGDPSLFESFATALEVPPVLIARLKRAMGSPAALEEAWTRSSTPARNGAHPLAGLLAGRPEAEAAALIEDLWSMTGTGAVGGRDAAEVARRLVTRAAEAAAPMFTPANAALLRRFLAVNDDPEAAIDAAAEIAREAGVDLAKPLDAWRRRVQAMAAAGVPLQATRLRTAFGRPFAYYDGFLFEVRSAALSEDQAVAAGGRYDALPVALGGAVAGAVGAIVRPGRAWSGAA